MSSLPTNSSYGPTAAGNPTEWPIATKMTSGALGTVNDVLSKSKSLVSPMSPARNTTIPVIDAIQSDLVTASQPGADLTDVENAIGSIATAASTLGAATSNLPTQRTYVSNLSDSLTTGVGALVGANVNEAATKPAALQGEPLPGAQALSISNSNTKLILKLFEL